MWTWSLHAPGAPAAPGCPQCATRQARRVRRAPLLRRRWVAELLTTFERPCQTCRVRCPVCGGSGARTDAARAQRLGGTALAIAYGLIGLCAAGLWPIVHFFLSFMGEGPSPVTMAMLLVALPTGGALLGWHEGRARAQARLRRTPGPLACGSCGHGWTWTASR